MMQSKYEILLYAPESDPVEGATLINCLSENARIAIFGKDDPCRLPDWPTDKQSLIFNLAAAAKILEHSDPKDLVLLIGGLTHKPIMDFLKDRICIEPFCGYEGIMTDKVAFESYFHMARVYQKYGHDNVRWFDAPVIHPFVDPNEFLFPSVPKSSDGEYLLYLGRLIARKSIRLCGEIAAATGRKLVVAGSGMKEYEEGRYLVAQDGTRVECDVKYVGPVGVLERSDLMKNALATLTLTNYHEPGCNVMFESLCSGTPVISTDSGIFPEIIRDGVNGFRIHSMKEAIAAVMSCSVLEREAIRQDTVANYGLEATAPKFEKWFNRLLTLWEKGFYQL